MSTEDPRGPIANLLHVLDLRPLGSAQVSVRATHSVDGTPIDLVDEEQEVFVADSLPMPYGRVYGGQVLAQSVMAGGLTVPAEEDGTVRRLHSLHAYFVRPGDDQSPIHFIVQRIRDGASFSARRVMAVQHGRTILNLASSFQRPGPGLDHQDPMPEVPEPESLPSLLEKYDDGHTQVLLRARAIEQRYVEGDVYGSPAKERIAYQNVWMRAVSPLPDDPLIHDAVLAYASDSALLQSIARRHGYSFRDPRLRIASIDHAMWFHRSFRADDWLLYATQSPTAQNARGLSFGRCFTQDGALVATVAQEGLFAVKG